MALEFSPAARAASDAVGDRPDKPTYDEYRATRYFKMLDGVRGVSILLVLMVHTPALSTVTAGYLGVQVFFVLSGYLITTLALREEADRGSLSLSGFYVRRAARILPLYYLALGVFVFVIVFVHQLEADRYPMGPALPYYLTYMNDLAPRTGFSHTWSLGVEEKFYLAWPVLGFVMLRRFTVRGRSIVTGLLAVGLLLSPLLGVTVLNDYGAILVGCLLAIALHHEPTYTRLAGLVRGWWIGVAVLALVVLHVSIGVAGDVRNGFAVRATDGVFILLVGAYAFACAAVLGLTLIHGGLVARVLRMPALVYVGTLAYGMYLFHPLAIASVFHFLPEAFEHGQLTVVPFVLATFVSIAVAIVLNRLIERPCIAFGRRVATRLRRRD